MFKKKHKEVSEPIKEAAKEYSSLADFMAFHFSVDFLLRKYCKLSDIDIQKLSEDEKRTIIQKKFQNRKK